MENWIDVIGLEKYYEVSDFGNVRSKPRKAKANYGVREYGGNLVKSFISSTGYPAVNLTVGSFRKQFHVHRLVLESFVGKPDKGYECCHNNGKREDCRLENLRWDTRKNNHNDKKLHGTNQIGSKNSAAKLNEEQATFIKYAKKPIKELAKKYNISEKTVENIRYGKTWKHI